jgi:hypothetical protein
MEDSERNSQQNKYLAWHRNHGFQLFIGHAILVHDCQFHTGDMPYGGLVVVMCRLRKSTDCLIWISKICKRLWRRLDSGCRAEMIEGVKGTGWGYLYWPVSFENWRKDCWSAYLFSKKCAKRKVNNNNNNNNIYLTAIGLSPGGSGYLTCIQK